MKPGKLVDDLYTLRAKRLLMEKEVLVLKAKETAIKNLLFVDLPALGLDAASGKIASASIKPILVPEIMDAEKDWPKLYKYIQKHGTFEMLHKRLTAEPFLERYALGETVPGVAIVTVMKLNLSKKGVK